MVSTVDSITNWFRDYWWVLLGFGILYIYFKYRKNESVFNFTIKEMLLIIESGVFFIFIYFLQKYFFFEHSYFLITIPFFIAIWSMFINYILSKDNVYMIECAFNGEEFNNVEDGETIFSLTTRLRILIMDRGFYETKKHIGETLNPLWNSSRNIKFTNLYHDKSGVFYHSEYPQLQNVNFYSCVMLWLKLKEELPKLIRENLVLTWLKDWNVAHEQTLLSENQINRLKGFNEQTKDEPFIMPKDAKELMDYAKNLKREAENSNTTVNINSNTQSENLESE